MTPPYVHFDHAARLLRDHGFTLASTASNAPIPRDTATAGRGFWRQEIHNPPTTVGVAAIIDQARAEAHDRGHSVIGPDHVLLAALRDESVAQLVHGHGVDPGQLASSLVNLLPV